MTPGPLKAVFNTKYVTLEIKQTRKLEAVVPGDATPDELQDLGRLLHARCVRSEMDMPKVEIIAKERELGDAEVRAIRRSHQWHLVYHPHTAEPLRNRGSAHSELVEHFGGENGENPLLYATVVVEFPDGDITHGTIYFRERFAVVAAFFADRYHFGVLAVADYHYPVHGDTRLLPWAMVQPCSMNERYSVDRLIEAMEDSDGQYADDYATEPVDEAKLPPNVELVRVQPRASKYRYELMYQYNGGDY